MDSLRNIYFLSIIFYYIVHYIIKEKTSHCLSEYSEYILNLNP